MLRELSCAVQEEGRVGRQPNPAPRFAHLVHLSAEDHSEGIPAKGPGMLITFFHQRKGKLARDPMRYVRQSIPRRVFLQSQSLGLKLLCPFCDLAAPALLISFSKDKKETSGVISSGGPRPATAGACRRMNRLSGSGTGSSETAAKRGGGGARPKSASSSRPRSSLAVHGTSTVWWGCLCSFQHCCVSQHHL